MVPAENERDRREIGAVLCSADTFLCKVSQQMSIEDVSNEITLCEVALKKRKSFALKSVENAKAVRAT